MCSETVKKVGRNAFVTSKDVIFLMNVPNGTIVVLTHLDPEMSQNNLR